MWFLFYLRNLTSPNNQNIPLKENDADVTQDKNNLSKTTLLLEDSSEEMMVTPDMPLLANTSPLLNHVNNKMYFIGPPPLVPIETSSSLVTPETGFHFLFTSEQTVDLTNLEKQEQKLDWSSY